MNKEENNFEQFLRSQLENHTVEVSDSVWAGIEKKQKKREKFVWFKQYLNVFIALDVVFVLGFAAFSFLNSSEVQSQINTRQIAQIEPTPKTPNEYLKASTKTTEQAIETISIYDKKRIPKNKSLAIKNVTNISTTKHKIVEDDKRFSSKKDIAVISNKPIKNKDKKTDNVLFNQPVHKELLEVSKQPKDYAWASLIEVKKYHFSKEITLNNSVIQNREALIYMPNVNAQSKPKKIIKAEQKAREKQQQALAKQEQLQKQATAKLEKAIAQQLAALQEKDIAQEKAEEAINAVGDAEIAPLILDTIYGKKKFKGYFAIDALISPEIAGSSLKGNNQLVEQYISRRDSAEKLQISYSASLRINLFINRNVFINTGFIYAQRKEKFSIEHKWQTHEDYIDSSKYITIIDPFAGNTIYKTYDTLDYVRTYKENLNHNLTMTFVDIPALIGYKWLGKKSGIAIQGGVVFNLLFKQKGSIANFNYTAKDVTANDENPYKTKTGLSIAGGIVTNHKLTNKLDLLIEPHTRYMLKPINNNGYPLQQKLFTYGLNVGLRLKI